MRSQALTRSEAFAVTDHRCNAGPADAPFTEHHKGFSISYVRKGSFGYQRYDQTFELIAGSILVGRAGAEYRCTHDHHAGGDECLSFDLASAVVEWIGGGSEVWQIGCVPPLPELMVAGELAQTAAEGRGDISLEEAGGCSSPAVSTRSRAVGAKRGACNRGTAGAPSKLRCGSMRTRTSRSISIALLAPPDLARSTFCGCSRKYSG